MTNNQPYHRVQQKEPEMYDRFVATHWNVETLDLMCETLEISTPQDYALFFTDLICAAMETEGIPLTNRNQIFERMKKVFP